MRSAGDAEAMAARVKELEEQGEEMREKIQSLREQRNDAYQWIEDVQRDGQLERVEELEQKVTSLRKQRDDAFTWVDERKKQDAVDNFDRKQIEVLEAKVKELRGRLGEEDQGEAGREVKNESISLANLTAEQREHRIEIDALVASNKELEAKLAMMQKQRTETYLTAEKYHRKVVAARSPADDAGSALRDSPQRSPIARNLQRELSATFENGAKYEAMFAALGNETLDCIADRDKYRSRMESQRETANRKITSLNNCVAELQLKLEKVLQQLHDRATPEPDEERRIPACCRRETARTTKANRELKKMLESLRASVQQYAKERDRARADLAALKEGRPAPKGPIASFLSKIGKTNTDLSAMTVSADRTAKNLTMSSLADDSPNEHSDPCAGRASQPSPAGEEVDALKKQLTQLESRVQVKDFKIKKLKQQRSESREQVSQLSLKQGVMQENASEEMKSATIEMAAMQLRVRELEAKVASLRKQRNELSRERAETSSPEPPPA
eukprot:TRINITY_DN9496_c0_g2_i1.p1 TRINITY_DN9496_c0_g2~~TRINITY_DN9496_c0_g2_i1.p1  ORF type:complete len:502 (+),score=154.25 TRINITY_DN9496_c0_g2_i1:110-1615(+)